MTRPLMPAMALCAMALSFAADGQMGRGMMGGGMMGGGMTMSMRRHHFVMMNGIDSQYATKTNPLSATQENLSAGRALYDRNCATCHGAGGQGDGPGGQNLDPRPANMPRSPRCRWRPTVT